MRAVVALHGGTVEKFIGDAVMAVFGMPTVHEDDALRAVRAAAQMREAIAELNRDLARDWGIEISIRIGVNTGEVVAGDIETGHALVTGDAVNVAARLEAAAAPGEILIGDATYRLVPNAVLVEPVEPLQLKGKEHPVEAWRLLGVIADAPSLARHPESPIVGRDRELALLAQAFDRASVDRTCHLVTLLGPAGVGKSRLAKELMSTVSGDASVLFGRCLPYGEGITYWPIADVVKKAAGITPGLSAKATKEHLIATLGAEPRADEIAERLAALLGATELRVSTADRSWAVRKLLEAIARERPVVVVFDDVQWGKQTFLDLVEHLAEWTREAPILIVCLARPELLEERPAWGGGKLNATSLLLEPLDDESCGRLIDNLLEQAEVAEGVKSRIAAAAEGNPLFVEEMLAMLIDEGTLRQEDGRWLATRDVSTIEVPPTIQALLAARIDQLAPGELRVLEHAAVAGKLFSRGALRALAGDQPLEGLDDQLASLVRKQLILPHRALFAGEDTFRFRHILIRDAAYQGMSMEARAELHERFARWLERARIASPEVEEILGYHLEQAYRFRSELGGGNGSAAALAVRAASHLASAGHNAFERNDMPTAVGLLSRASSLLSENDELRLALAPEFARALIETGDIVRADAVLAAALEVASRTGDARLEALAWLERSYLSRSGRPGPGDEDGAPTPTALIAIFEERGDDLGLAKALQLVALEEWFHCRYGAMETALERALGHARTAGARREVTNILNGLARAAALGPRPVEDALRRCEALRDEAAGDRSLEAFFDAVQAVLEAMRGSFADARELYARSRSAFEDLGLEMQVAGLTTYSGLVELLAGDAAAAERELGQGYQQLDRMGERGVRSTVAAFLARALYEQGRVREAERYAAISENASGEDDIVSQVGWRQVQALILAERGESEAALKLANEAVRLAAETEYLTMHGDSLLALAEVESRAGDGHGSMRSAGEALRLYEAKGDVVSAARARALLGGSLDRAPVRE
jgi:tetratricopeptide (TPR) repeat protein